MQMTKISGNPQNSAFNAVVKAPPGFSMGLHSHTADFVGVTLNDGMAHWATADKPTALP